MLAQDLAGKTILVTGGTSGIGLAIAARFADAGAHVHVTGTRAATSDYDVDLSRFRFHSCRLERPEDREALFDGVGSLDVLVNNAGGSSPDEYQLENFAATLNLNLVAVMDLCVRAHAVLTKPGGAIVNIGSIVSFLANDRSPGYTAAKSGLLGLTRALGARWASDGVRVNMIAPGFIATDLFAAHFKGQRAEKAMQRIPFGRWGEPREIASAALFLASDAASYITGTSLTIDGGAMLR
ncbi:SDR family NAD(P)-dependent oxidoreductase [Sphingobium sp. EM0848]|uniref:SDR family NAD(P)-dependent oxidoreductase n=1 Tax=Sphingobium sp. EM0848 TaxID=2743473 RepID=UPI00159C4987|nr:SDR family oxidoreductase [Sphingobium sp. EM0848]